MNNLFQKILKHKQVSTTFKLGYINLPESLSFWDQPQLKCIIHPVEILPQRIYN